MQCWKVQEKSAVWAVEPSILATESRYRTESGVDFMGRIELDFPAGIWEPFATQRPPYPLFRRVSDLFAGHPGHLLLLSEIRSDQKLHAVGGRRGADFAHL